MRRGFWRVGPEHTVSLEPWCLMGVVNATPDSFSDGGLHLDPERAARHAVELVDAGASIIDVGGESTRPGAERVSPSAQMDRVVPVIRSLRSALGDREATVTIDTTSAEVAAAGLDAGADAVNDVSGGLEDDRMLGLVAERRVGIVLMHRLQPPEEDSYSDQYETEPTYQDVVAEVGGLLGDRIRAAERAGIAKDAIMVDPGFGFGKSVEQNFALMRGIDRIVGLGHPVLVGLSRKSFLGAATGVADPARRDPESATAAVLIGDPRGLVFRVHDVAAHRRALLLRSAMQVP